MNTEPELASSWESDVELTGAPFHKHTPAPASDRFKRENYIRTGYLGEDRPSEATLSGILDKGGGNRDDHASLEISYTRLQEAAEKLFGDKKSMPADEFLALTKSFYSNLDLKTRGIPGELLDSALLLEYFDKAVREVRNNTTESGRSNRTLVMGCGTGRLAELHIELAKHLGQKEIVFNDLLPEHVESTRALIAKTYNIPNRDEVLVVDNLKVRFAPGDFFQIAEKLEEKSFDVITAMWFVTSEILDLESSQKLRQRRVDFFRKVRTILTDRGIFIEDIPESRQSGFYNLSRLKTHHILKKMGILDEPRGENINLGLTNIPGKEKNPYHIRYLGFNGGHQEEMKAAGLIEVDSVVRTIPGEADIKDSPEFKKMFTSRTTVEEVLRRVQSLLSNFTRATAVPETTKKKRLTSWTPNFS